MSIRFIALAVALCLCAQPLTAQSPGTRFEVGAQLTTVASGEFDAPDIGVSGRVGWRPIPLIGAEAEIGFYPGDFPDRAPFSRGRVEGFFGVTAGPVLGRIRPFVKLRPGFFTFHEAPEPFPCIRIFPPPLACALGSGRTSFALDLGGGLEVLATPRTFVRIDLGDRLMKYPGPVLDRERGVRTDGFVGHDFRLAVGGGLRF